MEEKQLLNYCEELIEYGFNPDLDKKSLRVLSKIYNRPNLDESTRARIDVIMNYMGGPSKCT
jgi:hypothetical protein